MASSVFLQYSTGASFLKPRKTLKKRYFFVKKAPKNEKTSQKSVFSLRSLGFWLRWPALHIGFTRMISLIHRLRLKKLDKLRFRLSCTLYKNPILLPSAFLLLGGALGLFSVQPLSSPENTAVNPKTDQAARASAARQYAHEEKLKEMSVELSSLQARAARLDAFGQKWVDEAGLEKAGFDFASDPAQGGPDIGDDQERFEAPSIPVMREDISELAKNYDHLEAQLSILGHWEAVQDKVPEGVPYASPGGLYMTSSFGRRYDPFGQGRRFHSGIDLAARVGDPVMAMGEGRVVFAGWRGGYGNMVEVDHGSGHTTRYAHNSRLLVHKGQLVATGTVIAKAGSTGRSTGAHLHIEVLKNGKQVDPRPFLERGRLLALEQKAILERLALLNKKSSTQG